MDAQGTGHQSAKDGNGSEGDGGGNCGGEGKGGGVCCGEGDNNDGNNDGCGDIGESYGNYKSSSDAMAVAVAAASAIAMATATSMMVATAMAMAMAMAMATAHDGCIEGNWVGNAAAAAVTAASTTAVKAVTRQGRWQWLQRM